MIFVDEKSMKDAIGRPRRLELQRKLEPKVTISGLVEMFQEASWDILVVYFLMFEVVLVGLLHGWLIYLVWNMA